MTPTTITPEAARLAEERQRFEAYIRKDCGDLTTFGRGENMHYLNSAVNNAWLGWLERSKQDAAPTSASTVPAEEAREHSPDDMTVPAPTTELAIGDYVFACRWGDGEPGDPWAVGWIDEINLTGITKFVGLQGSHRGWRRAMKITEEQGHRICALYPAAESLGHQDRLAARAEAFGLARNPGACSVTDGEDAPR